MKSSAQWLVDGNLSDWQPDANFIDVDKTSENFAKGALASSVG
jgi:hypothetical protein